MPRVALGLAGLMALSGCARMAEGEMRAALGQWFALGETVGFAAQQGCAAGVFSLVDTQIGSAMPVVPSAGQAVIMVRERGRMALDDAALTPDRAMVDIANLDRELGMRLRRAALEGRACMDALTESAFRHALTQPEAVLAHDADLGALILMAPREGRLIVAMGDRP